MGIAGIGSKMKLGESGWEWGDEVWGAGKIKFCGIWVVVLEIENACRRGR